ncbi:hypothetical protein Tco_1281526, partial [Tanacetum coccineum]
LCHEVYMITVGLGGLGGGSELCIWSLLALWCGTLGDVNALATSTSHMRVFFAGSDGQAMLAMNLLPTQLKSGTTLGIVYVRAHTHDLRALTIFVPIDREAPRPAKATTYLKEVLQAAAEASTFYSLSMIALTTST